MVGRRSGWMNTRLCNLPSGKAYTPHSSKFPLSHPMPTFTHPKKRLLDPMMAARKGKDTIGLYLLLLMAFFGLAMGQSSAANAVIVHDYAGFTPMSDHPPVVFSLLAEAIENVEDDESLSEDETHAFALLANLFTHTPFSLDTFGVSFSIEGQRPKLVAQGPGIFTLDCAWLL